LANISKNSLEIAFLNRNTQTHVEV